MATLDDVQEFWHMNPCGSDTARQYGDRLQYFREIEAHRYSTEPHIPRVAGFGKFAARAVLEIGCGMGTDGSQFAARGALYTGVDLSAASVNFSKERFRLMGLPGNFAVCNAEDLPFSDNSFDHIYSFGVIHHSPNPEGIAGEMYRVLRPGGTFTVMLYNRTSLNFKVEIMGIRKAFRWLLLPSFAVPLLSAIIGVSKDKLARHRQILIQRPRMSEPEWVSINTDGPDCPLSRVYSASEALRLFDQFCDVTTEVYHLSRRHPPITGRLVPGFIRPQLGEKWGWHRIVSGRKPYSGTKPSDPS